MMLNSTITIVLRQIPDNKGPKKRGQVTRSLIAEFAVRAYLDDFEENGQDTKLAKLLSAI